MIRIRSSGEICLVAAVARRWQRCVVVVYVALYARNRNVRTRERESCVVVVESCLRPRSGVMASRACSGETRSGVIGIRRSDIVGLVARVAIRGHGCVVVVRMALRAGNADMSPGQGECTRRVIECRRTPAIGRVAYRAICRET